MHNNKTPYTSTAHTMGSKMKIAMKEYGGIIVALVILIVIASIASDKYLTFDNLMIVLKTTSTTAFCAFGMLFVILSGGIDLAGGAFMALAGCVTTTLVAWCDFAILPACMAGIVVAAAFGFANGLIIIKLNIPPFIVTMATMNIMRGLTFTLTGGGTVTLQRREFYQIGGSTIGELPISAVYIIIAFFILWIILNRTGYGRHLYAVGENMQAAKYAGIHTDRVIYSVYIINSILCAFGGIILCARMNSGQPTIGDGAELNAIAACVVGGASLAGGKGTLAGTLIGVFIMGVLSNMLNLTGVDIFIQMIVKGIVILLGVSINTLKDRPQKAMQ